MSLGDLAVSTGSACSAGSQKVSHVLEAIGAPESAGPSIRFGLGRHTTDLEIDTAAARVVKVVRSLRGSGVTA
jgi:cysteine desulfurase